MIARLPQSPKASDDPTVVGESSIHGRGLFAARRIRSGAKIGEYRGPKTQRDGMHVLWVEGDDGEYFGINGKNGLRYLNHSSAPNAYFDGADLYAERSIAKGEEITFHYGEDWEDVA